MSSKPTRIAVFCGFTLLIGLFAVADKPTAKHEAIRDALEGELPENPSADGVFDDVLRVIKDRGSILDGSVLDQQPVIADRKSAATERAIAAEQLLKASRMLEQLASSDGNRASLVKRMRGEAAKLLSE